MAYSVWLGGGEHGVAGRQAPAEMVPGTFSLSHQGAAHTFLTVLSLSFSVKVGIVWRKVITTAREYMIENFEHKGIWWLPERPDTQVAGTLRFVQNEEITLDLIGTFIPGDIMRTSHDPIIILGATENGRLVTLYRNFLTSTKINFPGFPIHTYVVNHAFIGKHFESEEQILFHSFHVNFSHLEEWLSGNRFDTTHERGEDDKKRFKVTCNFPEKHSIRLEQLKSELSSSYNFQYKGDGFRELNLKYCDLLEITPDIPQALDWFLRAIYDLQLFLTLVIGIPVQPKLLSARTMGSSPQEERHLIDYYHLLSFSIPEKKIGRHDVLFTFPQLREVLNSMANRWFEQADNLRPVYNLFFGAFYRADSYQESNFLILIQALEAFHRRVYGGKYLSEQEFLNARTTLESAIQSEWPEEFKASLAGKFQFLNELSLRKRLRHMLEHLGEEIVNVILGSESREGFTNKIVNTRNYLSHYDKTLEGKAVKGVELFHLNKKIRASLCSLLLKNLGLEASKIVGAIKSNRNYSDISK